MNDDNNNLIQVNNQKNKKAKENKLINILDVILNNISLEDENNKNKIKGSTKNTTSFILSFIVDENLKKFKTIREYVQKSYGVYRFGHAFK